MDQTLTPPLPDSSRPLISVLLPVYNGAAYLRAALDSILGQTFADFEVLAINDGSTDESAAILASYADPRLRVIHNERNLKLTATLNKGIGLARGQYLARMDCDDISLPTRFEKQAQFLTQHPEVGVLGTNYQIMNANGQRGMVSRYPCQHGLIRWRLIFGSYIAHPSVMMRTEVIQRIGGYQLFSVSQDYELWSRAAWETRLANLPEALLWLRSHPASSSSMADETVRRNSARISQSVAQRMAGEVISEATARQLREWRFPSQDEALAAARVIQRLARANLADATLTDEEKHLIRLDAAKWILHLLRQYPAWSMLGAAWQTDPWLPLHVIGWALDKTRRSKP